MSSLERTFARRFRRRLEADSVFRRNLARSDVGRAMLKRVMVRDHQADRRKAMQEKRERGE